MPRESVADDNLPEVGLLPDWLPAGEADVLLADLLAQVPWEVHRIRMFGRWVDSPRLSCWIGDPGTGYVYSGARFEPRPWPAALQALRLRASHCVVTPMLATLMAQRVGQGERPPQLKVVMSGAGPVDGQLDQQFQQAVEEFDKALGELQNAEQNTPAIKQALQKAEAQWSFSRAGFRLSGDSRFVPTLITTTTEPLLRQMQDLTSAYEGVMLAGS